MQNQDPVTFDPLKLRIKIRPEILSKSGLIQLDVRRDVYSPWKRWFRKNMNSRFPPAIQSIGGEPLPNGESSSRHFILGGGWRIEPPNECETIELIGDIQVDRNIPAFTPCPDGRRVSISLPYSYEESDRSRWCNAVLTTLGWIGTIFWIYKERTQAEPWITSLLLFGASVASWNPILNKYLRIKRLGGRNIV